MNKGLAHILLTRIGNMSFIDIYAGIVSVQEKEDLIMDDTSSPNGRKVIQRFPVSCDIIDYGKCLEPGKLMPLIPDSARKGILYFEDMGTDPLGRDGIYYKYKSQLRLVSWLNTKHIALNPCHELTMPVMTYIISRLTGNPFNQNNFLKIQVAVNKIPRTGKEIFDKYTYDVATTQYLMPPYEYFALDLQVTYCIHPDCINQIQLKTPDQC